MNQTKINNYFKTGRIQLTTWETIEHYSFLLPILIIPIIFLYNDISKDGTIDRIPVFEIIMFLLAVYFIYHNYKVLEFKKYRLPHSTEDFRAAAIATAKELNWEIENLNNNALIAGKYDLNGQWDGLKITIIREGEKIYSNSMVIPSLRSNPFSVKWNEKNLRIFNNNLIYATKGENVIEKVETKIKREGIQIESESEWSIKNSGKRIIAYACIFVLLFVCAIILVSGFNFIIVPIIAVCMWYLVLDWITIIKNMRNEKA